MKYWVGCFGTGENMFSGTNEIHSYPIAKPNSNPNLKHKHKRATVWA